MDFLTFSHRISIKPYPKTQIQKNKSQKNFKIAKSCDNPLLDCLPQQEPIKSDQFDKNIEELIHNAQVAKKLECSILNEISTIKSKTKFLYFKDRNKNNRNYKRNKLSLTPYQKYEKEKQFTIDRIKTKQDISNVNKYFDKNYCQASCIKNRRKLVCIPKTNLRVRSYQSNSNNNNSINDLFHISNTLIKELNRTNVICNTIVDIKRNYIKTVHIKPSISINAKTTISSPFKNINIKRRLTAMHKQPLIIKGY